VTELDDWIEKEARSAAGAMLSAVSATRIVKERPGFGQRVVPRPGSVVASPVLAAYDPDPDYFFHWFRDSAIIIDALRVALGDGLTDATSIERLREFVDFNRALRNLDGRQFLAQGDFRKKVQPSFLQYLRPDEEIAAVFDNAVLAEARVNPDGTLDFARWARPQNDGPALQVLALARWRDAEPGLDKRLQAAMLELVVSDLDFIRSRATERSFDIWEEESGHHYYTRLVQAEALSCGAKWLEEIGDGTRARNCRSVTNELDASLGSYWSAADNYYRSRIGVIGGGASSKALDVSVILGMLHAGRRAETHSVLDPRAQATLAALEDLFDAEYALNHQRPPDRGTAIGRYAKDAYYGGNPWYLATLAAAEFYFRLAFALQSGAQLVVTDNNARFRERLAGESPTTAAFERGESFMRTVRAYTPASGNLSEQFDRATGAQTSAKRLAWSYAAFITAAASRRQAAQAIRD
jgi:glucoamylase